MTSPCSPAPAVCLLAAVLSMGWGGAGGGGNAPRPGPDPQHPQGDAGGVDGLAPDPARLDAAVSTPCQYFECGTAHPAQSCDGATFHRQCVRQAGGRCGFE